MPDNWIGTILLTDEIEISVDGTKIHDLLEQNDYGGDVIAVDASTHPVLHSKLPASVYVYSGNTLQTDYGKDIAWDGTHFWKAHDVNGEIVQYTEDFVATGFVITTNSVPRGLDFSEGSLWVVKFSRNITEYSLGGTVLQVIPVPEISNSFSGLTKIKDYIYILEEDGEVLQFTVDGYTGITYQLSQLSGTKQTFTNDGDKLWIGVGGFCYKIEPTTGATLDSFSISSELTTISTGMCYKGSSIIIKNQNDSVIEYVGSAVIPNMTPPEGSRKRYKIIADKT